jgi:hypothetical protein
MRECQQWLAVACRRSETRRSASSVRPRGLGKRRRAENCPLGFNWRGASPGLRTCRGGCEYRVQIVARTGCKIRTDCDHGVRFGVISGRFEFWRETGLPSLIYHEPVHEVRFMRGAAGTTRILTIRVSDILPLDREVKMKTPVKIQLH